MPPLADQEDGEENSDEESTDWVDYDTFLERCNFMREMLSAAKRPKKMHFLSSVLKKNEFLGGGKKSGIRVFIETWYLSTRLPIGLKFLRKCVILWFRPKFVSNPPLGWGGGGGKTLRN